jgi:hypothetical protein
VFDGVAPSLTIALSQTGDERSAWEMAGAKGISFLMQGLRDDIGRVSYTLVVPMTADVSLVCNKCKFVYALVLFSF